MLFFVENNDIMLLLGREEIEKSSISESMIESKEESSEEQGTCEINYSDKESKEEEEDDDSPYFVKITIDSGFLSHLEDPNLVEVSELNNQFDDLTNNSIFKEIIKREIEMMFGDEKRKDFLSNSPSKRASLV